MKIILTLIIGLLLITSCSNKSKQNEKEVILLAERESSLAKVYLKIYQDSTFLFESIGMRFSTIYKGKAEIDQNKIEFNYNGSNPKAGNSAVYDKNTLSYNNGDYLEPFKITFTKLDL